jgi:hypothetical protein
MPTTTVPGVAAVVNRPNAVNSSREPISRVPPGMTIGGAGEMSPIAAVPV